MRKHLIVKDGIVIDSIVWDNSSPWSYPFAFDSIIESEEGGIGWSYVDGVLLPPANEE